MIEVRAAALALLLAALLAAPAAPLRAQPVNKEVIIPNKAFITERVVNWTLSDQVTRLVLNVGVAYGTDIARVQQLLLDAVHSNPDVQRTPPPSVYCVGFSEGALDFEVCGFVASLDMRLRVRHEIYFAIERTLREHGIEIAPPQREVQSRGAAGRGAPASSRDDGLVASRSHPA